MPDPRTVAFAVITSAVVFGTLYSVGYDTYLDTSNPLITAQPHHLHETDYFASKKNPLNVYFIKKLWLWTTATFLSLFLTSPSATRTKARVSQYIIATTVWLAFTSWFFGPPVFDRLTASTGGECVLHLPSGAVVTVPEQYCYTKSTISTTTHSALFPASLLLPDGEWVGVPRLRKGHDVSGHIFLLTLSTLFLVDQLRLSFTPPRGARASSTQWSPAHRWAVIFAGIVTLTSVFAIYTTSVYFHTPSEKFTGYIMGVIAFSLTQLPHYLSSETGATHNGEAPSAPATSEKVSS
ncbi:inositol phospholipid synthesis and fat-storage-inducing TM-domain-containing protein [Trametes polyzona]|nr:inositol phospholipid synthesis and fat-storage-inducing TM-domain-containing protein [Trametes polyzona]